MLPITDANAYICFVKTYGVLYTKISRIMPPPNKSKLRLTAINEPEIAKAIAPISYIIKIIVVPFIIFLIWVKAPFPLLLL